MSGRILVIGGGFAGFWAAVAARRVDPGADVSLVSDCDHLVMRPRLYEAHPEALAEPLSPLLELVEVRLEVARVDDVDPGAGIAQLDNGETLSYDVGVVAAGSRLRRPRLAGAEHCHSIDDWDTARAFDAALARLAATPAPTVVVIGAGFVGIELALELADRFAAHGRPSHLPAPRTVLVDQAPVVGVELGEGPRPAIEGALDAAGIERVLGGGVAEVTGGGVRLADATTIPADLVVLCTGLEAAPLAGRLGAPVDRLGRVAVDEYLRVPGPGAGRLFAAGDVAAAAAGEGRTTLQSCQHALLLGRVAGENAARQLRGEPLVAYRPPTYVTCLALGRSGAVRTTGWDRTVVETGSAAGAVKRHINTEAIYPDATGGRQGLLAQSRIYGPGAPDR